MCNVPVEVWLLIIGNDIEVYRGLLALPPFARWLTSATIAQFKVGLGFTRHLLGPSHVAYYYARPGAKLAPVLHRADGPALVIPGMNAYYVRGCLHRIGAPALVYTDGLSWSYYYRDILHRSDGPAYVDAQQGIVEYRFHGMLHRDDGPAHIDERRGIEKWYRRGALHNARGPAIVHRDDHARDEYHYHGTRLPYERWAGSLYAGPAPRPLDSTDDTIDDDWRDLD